MVPAADRRPEPSSTRPTIGYLTPRIGDNISQALWSGVVDGAREEGANLICIVGGELADDSPANAAYGLATAEVVDGLVTWGSSIGGSLGRADVASFHRRYYPLPLVSITLPLPGIPAVLIDSYQGMRDVMAHLFETHGYSRLAFIAGPESHYYAQERLRAYTDALQAYGLPLDPNLVTAPAEFSLASGRQGIRLLLDERKLRPGTGLEAVVTVSDLPALGALRELQARGIAVPETLALAGFNDTPEGRFAIPPLTSVKLPFYEQGRMAVQMLLALVAGEEVAEQVALPTRLRVRRSCGCLLPSVVQAASPTSPPRGDRTLAEALAARREIILAAMMWAAEASGQEPHPGWAARLFAAFAVEVSGDPPAAGTFLTELEQILRQVMLARGQVHDWQNVISTLRRHALPCFGPADGEAMRRAENLWGQARVSIGEGAQRARGQQMVHQAQQNEALRRISHALATTFDVAELAGVLARDLPGVGIDCCYLAQYENTQDPTGRSRLILDCDKGGGIEFQAGEQSFPSDQLLPLLLSGRHRTGGAQGEPWGLVVEPLYFQQQPLGLALFGIGPREGAIYEVLRGQISSSLQGALLFEESRRARAAAEKADQLKTRLLANVSHELRTPLNVIMGSAREALTPGPDSAPLSAELRSNLMHIHDSAEHQLRVINDLLDLSRAEIDELDLYLEVLDSRSLLEQVFNSMAGSGGLSHVTWHLRLPDRLPAIEADPVRLRQILLNLLSNASKFVEQGKISLGAEVTPRHLHIWVQDTGPGIPLDMQERIFEPFTTVGLAHRQRPGLEGVGLGLSITRRLVALHGGSMRLESQQGQGSTFHVYLPLPTLGDRSPGLEAGDHRAPAGSAPSPPVLLLISAHDRPAAEIVEFSEQQGLELHRLQAGDDLEELLTGIRPAALVWDVADASSGDWPLIRRLRNHPRLSQMPFILYGQGAGQEPGLSLGLTDFVSKPLNGDGLMAAINGLCPRESAGPILIVDDDPQILTLYQQVVATSCPGYPVRTAADGQAALACMATETPSLVILDLMMPEIDGFEVLDWMRANSQTRQVPVLILSNRGLTLDDVKRLEGHARVTLQSKGILSETEIVAALHRILFGSEALPQHTSALVKRAIAYFHQNYQRPFARWEMAEAIGVSEDYLSRVFRRELDISPWEYLNRYRILQAIDRLRHTDEGMGAVAHRVGFKDPAYFSRVFRKVTGKSPSAYREEAE